MSASLQTVDRLYNEADGLKFTISRAVALAESGRMREAVNLLRRSAPSLVNHRLAPLPDNVVPFRARA
jgi:hypothetical protein